MKFDFEKKGEAIEKELLGVTKSHPERQKKIYENFLEYYERISKKDKFDFMKAIQDVKELRSFLPTDPYPAFASDIYNTIADNLEKQQIITEKEFNNLKYYTAIGPGEEKTPLDLFYGIDAFFELEKGDKVYRITLDLKTNPNYDPNTIKADIVCVVSLDFIAPMTYKNKNTFPQIKDLSEFQLKEYTRQYEELSKKIGDEIIKKIEKTL